MDNFMFNTKLSKLRSIMSSEGLDALIVNREDEHLSEYLPKSSERLSYISEFTGSAGTAVILQNENKITNQSRILTHNDIGEEVALQNSAALFVDGRYTTQANIQVSHSEWDTFHFQHFKVITWLKKILTPKSKVGIDAKCISHKQFKELKNSLAESKIELVITSYNLIDALKQNEIALKEKDDSPEEINCAYIYEDKYNGCPSIEKRKMIAQKLQELSVDLTIICKSESSNWLLNVRGNDVPNLPIVNGFLVVYASEHVEWYVDPRKIKPADLSNFQHHFGKIDYYPEENFWELLKRLGQSNSKIYLDPNETNAWIIENLIQYGASLTYGEDLCELPKAIKNPIEVAGMKKCHLRDSVAMCKFLAWLDNITEPLFIPKEELESNPNYNLLIEQIKLHNEQTISDQLFKFRAEQEHFVENSFDTISALGPNASVIHYNHKNLGNPRALGTDSIYLVDSGGQYLDGTTDITRTIAVGPNITEEIKTRFTLVLKGLIALHRVHFPKGINGGNLDVLARSPLWQQGLNFDHGTGHGVGHFLNVHEGPQSISPRNHSTPLQPGMITSIEPGYYKENEYGIRCENLSVVETVHKNNSVTMLNLAPITFVPFDLRLINKDMLTDNERTWLNDYHFKIREIVKDHLNDSEINWLLKATVAF